MFVDRDDTLAKDIPYCDDPDAFEVYQDVPGAIRRLNEAGFLVIVVTNQSGIGRGYFDEATLSAVHGKMVRSIEAGGGHIDDIFYCPHTPDDHCDCRKPAIGMGLRAVARYDIDTNQSYMVGDHEKDMEFGRRLGCTSIKVGPDRTFSQAVDEILGPCR